MKLLPLTLFLVFSLGFAYAQELVQEDDSGNPSLVVDDGELISSINNFLNTQAGFDPEVTSILIVESDDGGYYLQAKGSEYKVTIGLEEDGGTGIFIFAGITCTTKTCFATDGCVPEANKIKCSPCQGDCIKTTTSGNDLFDY